MEPLLTREHRGRDILQGGQKYRDVFLIDVSTLDFQDTVTNHRPGTVVTVK